MMSPSAFTHSLLSSCPMPNHLAESPGQPTPSDDPGETERGFVHSWLRDSAHVSPDHSAIPSAASYILWFSFQAIMVGNEDAGQFLNPIPKNAFHRVLPLPINLVHPCAYLYGGLNSGTDLEKVWNWDRSNLRMRLSPCEPLSYRNCM